MSHAGELFKLDLKAAHQVYKLASGRKVPGVTTVCGKTLSAEELYKWFHEQGANGIEWPCTAQVGADLGTVIHARCQAWIEGYAGVDPAGIPPDLLEQSIPATVRFQERFAARGLTLEHAELQLVSEHLKVGGTLDYVMRDSHGLLLIDLKSSKPYRKKKWTDLDLVDGKPKVAPYDKVQVQIGGYSVLWNENAANRGWEPIARAEVWRTGKAPEDPGQVHEFNGADLEACCWAFGSAARHYHALSELR
jgi:hypothetical protein